MPKALSFQKNKVNKNLKKIIMTHKKIPSGSQYYQQSEKVKKVKALGSRISIYRGAQRRREGRDEPPHLQLSKKNSPNCRTKPQTCVPPDR